MAINNKAPEVDLQTDSLERDPTHPEDKSDSATPSGQIVDTNPFF